ncbi:MAG: tRNA (adenine-N1)-methyltransferase [Desulfurococcaceae archaeon]
MSVLNEGDRVLVYIDKKRRFLITLERNGILGTDKGFIKHSDIIGKNYGDTVETSFGVKAFLYKPLLIDYQYVITRKTQIIYPKDAAFMIYLSGIKPGSRVLEAGVGSGFLTISLANFIGSNGKVYGFDIEPEFLKTTSLNLEKAGLIDRVELKLGDVRESVDLRDLDAVFYDLPDPWNALETAYSVLKPLHPVLIYVPTVNQVEKTVVEMREKGLFTDINVYELLLREYIVEKNATRPKTMAIGHTGYIIFARRVK